MSALEKCVAALLKLRPALEDVYAKAATRRVPTSRELDALDETWKLARAALDDAVTSPIEAEIRADERRRCAELVDTHAKVQANQAERRANAGRESDPYAHGAKVLRIAAEDLRTGGGS